jgi:hypothetical protein
MSLKRYAVTCSFCAWSPGDRDHPERKVSISPGSKYLFTDELGPAGSFIKFLKCGSWYEAERNEFARATEPAGEGQALSAQRGA